MVPRRVAPIVIAAALALAPTAASAGLPVALYPPRVPGLSPAQRADFHGVLQAGLASASRRGVLSPRSPALLPASCGELPSPECLAALAKGGLVLTGRGELRSGMVLVVLALWDSTGARSREVRLAVDLVIENLRPVNEALRELELEVEPDGTVSRSGSSPPHGSPAKPPSLAAAPPPLEPLAAEPPRANPRAAPGVPPPPARGPPLWKRRVGPWVTGLGAALLAGGAVVGYLNHDLAGDLDAKYARGSLGADDRASYDRVSRFNVLSTALFAAGGAATATGAWIWISAPAAPGRVAAVGAEGRF